MKATRYIAAFAFLAGLAACQRETVPSDGIDPEGFVEVTFQVSFPEPVAAPTRGLMGEGPLATEAFDLNLCLYNGDGDGYVQNWIPTTKKSITTDSNGYITGGVYSAYLPLTNESRIVHIIANPPDAVNPTTSDYIDNVMEKMVDTEQECSYWQQVILSRIDRTPQSVQPLTSGVHLVRNFAKIVVRSEEPTYDDGTENPRYGHFQVLRWTLINVPDRGYVAPYTGISSQRFPNSYLNVTAANVGTLYDNLKEEQYPGYMPAEATIDNTFPGDPDDAESASRYVGNNEALYMYERPLPTSTMIQTAVLVEVQFDEGYNIGDREDRTYWYKVEVLDNDGNYLPFLRDVVYRMKISGLEAAGSDTAEDAFNDVYFGNISASLETAGLNELSNGKSKISVDLMDYTFLTGGQDVILGKTGANDPTPAQFYYIPDLVDGTPYTKTTAGKCTITVTKVDVEGHDPAITAFSVSDEGVITVTLAETGSSIKKSIIRVAGKPGNANEPGQTIYRDISINLMDTQEFAHGSDVTRITNEPTVTGPLNEVDIMIHLPEDLGSSVFPIQVRIEAENNSLTAHSVDLPTALGKSVFDSNRNTYYFIRTIKYSEYCTLNPRTKKYEYKYNFPVTLYTSKQGDNSTWIDIRDLAGNFRQTVLSLGTPQ